MSTEDLTSDPTAKPTDRPPGSPTSTPTEVPTTLPPVTDEPSRLPTPGEKNHPINFLSPTVAPTKQPGCNNPFEADAESWNCQCHDVMLKEMKARGVTQSLSTPEWSAAYRSQLCKNPTVCDSWKEEACCKDSNDALKRELAKEQNSAAPETCASVRGNCEHPVIGAVVRLNCPQTCSLCPKHLSRRGAEVEVLLDDALAGRDSIGAGGWTLTPTPPVWTQTPTEDASCFADPENFDCSCHAKKQRQCGKDPYLRKELQRAHEGKVVSCEHFFVCTHSQTCQQYKNKHCQAELALLKKLKANHSRVDTC